MKLTFPSLKKIIYEELRKMKESKEEEWVEDVKVRFINRFKHMDLEKTEENFEKLLAKFKGDDHYNPEWAKQHYQDRYGFMDENEGNWEIVKNAWLASE